MNKVKRRRTFIVSIITARTDRDNCYDMEQVLITGMYSLHKSDTYLRGRGIDWYGVTTKSGARVAASQKALRKRLRIQERKR